MKAKFCRLTKAFFVGLVILLINYRSFGQKKITEELVNINHFFSQNECLYVQLKYSFYVPGNKSPLETKNAFVVVQKENVYNKIANNEVLKKGDMVITVDHALKTVTVTPTLINTAPQMYGMFTIIDTLLTSCGDKTLTTVNTKINKISLKGCASNYGLIEMEYQSKDYKPTKFVLHVMEKNYESGRIEIEYLDIKCLKKDKNGYLLTSRFVQQTRSGLELNTLNLRGYKLENYYSK